MCQIHEESAAPEARRCYITYVQIRVLNMNPLFLRFNRCSSMRIVEFFLLSCIETSISNSAFN